MSECSYAECSFRDSCDKTENDCLLASITHGQELAMIIRCKNCKFYVRAAEEGYCRKLQRKTNRQWYCGDGKWRDG